MMADGADEPNKRRRARHQGAVCMVARLEALSEDAEDIAEALAAFAAAVRASEPGCTSYYVTHSIGAPQHFAAHARFLDWAAFKAHGETPHLERALARVTPGLASPLALEIFLEV